MKHVILPTADILDSEGHSSRGNQAKWYRNGFWYKADHMGYEGLAEVVVSELLERSDVERFVPYRPVRITYGVHERSGCYCRNFLQKGSFLIPLERLHRNHTGSGLAGKLSEGKTAEERLRYTVDFVESVTGLSGFGAYLAELIEIDAFFLNEDRHTNNIAVLYDPKTDRYSLCPYFDFGLSLLSDLEFFWPDGDPEKHMQRVSAKPFGSFREQRDAAERLYGKLFIPSFSMSDVNTVLEELSEYYPEHILNRVRFVIEKQLHTFC